MTLLLEARYPMYPDYGKVMTGGCGGFARGVLHWPEDMILGGSQREDHRLKSADALQSVFLVASPNDVFLRFSSKASSKDLLIPSYCSARSEESEAKPEHDRVERRCRRAGSPADVKPLNSRLGDHYVAEDLHSKSL